MKSMACPHAFWSAAVAVLSQKITDSPTGTLYTVVTHSVMEVHPAYLTSTLTAKWGLEARGLDEEEADVEKGGIL